MDIQNGGQSFAKFVSSFERAKDALVHPDTLWHAVLYGVIGSFFVVGVFAYTTYAWAKENDQTAAPHTNATTLSLLELEGVIKTYDAMAKAHQDLLVNPTSTPYENYGSAQASPLSLSTTTATTTP